MQKIVLRLVLSCGLIGACNEEKTQPSSSQVPKLIVDSECTDGKQVCTMHLNASGDNTEVCYCWKGEFVEEDECQGTEGGTGFLRSIDPEDEAVSIEAAPNPQACPEGRLACTAVELPDDGEPSCSCDFLAPDTTDTVVCIGGDMPSDPSLVLDGCVVGGCSGQLCGESKNGWISTCEWKEEYACYQSAICERQADGMCGWTQTEELLACLSGA